MPLSAFARFEQDHEPLVITHQGQFPSVTVSFNLAPSASLGERDRGDRHACSATCTCRRASQAEFQGTRRRPSRLAVQRAAADPRGAGHRLHRARRALRELHPSDHDSVDAAVGGRGRAARAHALPSGLDVVAIIGIVLLIGIVKKNGIMMVDFALEARAQARARARRDAIYEASLLRFRPILMTTMAALLAGVPLALGTGFGSELRRPLGIAMVGGLLLSQVLTLYTTPVIYIFFDNLGDVESRDGERSRGGRSRARGGRTMNLSRLHPAAGGDDAAHRGRGARRRARVHRAAGRAAAAGRLPDHLRQRVAARAPARRSWRPRWRRRSSGSSATSPA